MDYTTIPIRGGFVNGDSIVDSLPVTFNADGIAEAVYRAPETFVRWGMPQESGDKNLKERDIQPTIDIANYFKTRKDPLPPIRLKRPPVVLVHGLWGCGNKGGCGQGGEYAWKTFEDRFNPPDKGNYDVFSVNYYEPGQVRSIVEHAYKIGEMIDDAFPKLRTKGYAVEKADIIAHSMGGLLTRQYCFDNQEDCQKRIRRFITIATPHFGSELADLLLVYRDQRQFFPDNSYISLHYGIPILMTCQSRVDALVSGNWGSDPHPIGPPRDIENPRGSAIDDLSTGTLPVFLNGITNRGQWSVYPPLPAVLRSHAVAGVLTEPVDGNDGDIRKLWEYVLRPCGFTRENVFGLGINNDRIVTEMSQRGNLSGNTSTLVGVDDHFGVRHSVQAISKIKLLLDDKVGNGSFARE